MGLYPENGVPDLAMQLSFRSLEDRKPMSTLRRVPTCEQATEVLVVPVGRWLVVPLGRWLVVPLGRRLVGRVGLVVPG